MNPQQSSHDSVNQIHAWAADPSPKRNFLFLDGPAASGKSAALREFADSAPGADLIDAANLSSEDLVDRIMRTLGVPFGDYRDLSSLTSIMKRHDLHHVVLVANAQWAGRTRSSTEPRLIENILARTLGSPYMKTGVRVVIEVDSEVHRLSSWNQSPVTLPARPGIDWPHFDSLSPDHRTATLALSLAEPRSIRFEEWRALCSILGTEFDDSELRTIAEELTFVTVTVDAENELPVRMTHESTAWKLRNEIPPEEFQAFQNAVVDRLFSCTEDDPLADYLARALPAHAAVAGRFEELLASPRAFTKCRHTALIEALPVAFPDGVPAGTYAADLHYLDALGLAPSSHAEWLSILHLVAISRGDTERAHALTENAGPLPWRTIWSNWRAPGRIPLPHPQLDAIDSVQANTANSTVTSETEAFVEQTWNATTGRLCDHEAVPTDNPAQQTVWQAECSWNVAHLQLAADSSVSRRVQAPAVWDTACIGGLVVMAGSRGLYAIQPNPHYTEANPQRPLPAVGPRCTITPRPFDAEHCAPTRARVLEVFSEDTAPTIPARQLPEGLTHEPTRRFLTEVGFPALTNFYSLDTHNLRDTGLVEHTWEAPTRSEEPVGDGPFYHLGHWIAGDLLLDGSTGRVLRHYVPGPHDDWGPGDPLAGSSLASFTAMVCLHWQYMLAYATSGGLDSEDILAELTAWLSAIDPAAAATRNWGHVLDSDEFTTL